MNILPINILFIGMALPIWSHQALGVAKATNPQVSSPASDSQTAREGQSLQGSDVPASAVVQKIDLPVTWQVTRARIVDSGATTETENFRELWMLEIRRGGLAFLTSRRGRVGCHAIGLNQGKVAAPTGLVITEQDFAKLIGVVVPGEDATDELEDPELSARSGKLLNLTLTQERGGVEFTLNISDEEHLAVHLEVGHPRLF